MTAVVEWRIYRGWNIFMYIYYGEDNGDEMEFVESQSDSKLIGCVLILKYKM